MPLPFPPRYAVTVVGPPATSASIGADGTVAAIEGSRAVVWREGKTLWSGDGYTLAAGPNARGQIALVGGGRLCLWQKGRVKPCETSVSGFFGSTGSVDTLLGIADSGQIVAVAQGLESTRYLMACPPLARPTAFFPTALAPDCLLAGTHGGPLFLHDGRPTAYLGERPLDDGSVSTVPRAVARGGIVVGSRVEGTRKVPFRWSSGGLVRLPVPGDDGQGEAIAVNAHGEAVGRAWWTAHRGTPLSSSTWTQETVGLWQGDRFTDLNAVAPDGWRLSTVLAINDSGWILATGTRDARDATVLLKPR